MRIGIDYNAAANQSAGIGRFTREIVRALAKIDHENEYFLFYARGSGGGTKARAAAPVVGDSPNFLERTIPVSDRTMTLIWHQLRLPLAVDLFTGPVDVFYFPDFTMAPLRRGHSIVSVHDLAFLLVPDCADAAERAYLERVVPASVHEADFVTVVSENTRNDVVTLLDVPEEKVEVIYGAVEPGFQRVADQAQLEAVRRRYRLHFHFILNVGLIEPRKNLPRLIQAYAQFREASGLPHKLVIVGRLGWQYQDVFREVEELSLGDDVVFPGFVQDADLPALYSLADAFAYPSLYEGFGLPPLEAMACGTPVVCSDASSLPEVVGDAALMVPPTDVEGLSHALGRVLEDETLRAEMVSKGHVRASLFSWDASARKLLGAFERAAARREAR